MLEVYHGFETVVDRVCQFMKPVGDQAQQQNSGVDQERLQTLVEFAKCYPIHVKKVKTASTGMDLVMSYDQVPLIKSSAANPAGNESDSKWSLVEFVWTKVMERHRNATTAFRSFDTKGKGKVKKAQLIEGFDKLRIRLSAKDIDQIWSLLDTQKKGYIHFNEFCVLQDVKNNQKGDLKAVETKVQDNLA